MKKMIMGLIAVTMLCGLAPQRAHASDAQAAVTSLCENVYEPSLMEKKAYSAFAGGSQDWMVVQSFTRPLLGLSKDLRREWFKAFAQVYQKSPQAETLPHSKRLSARRLLNSAMSLVDPFDINDFPSAEVGYAKFIQRQQELFSSQFSSEQILDFARFIQADLMRLKKENASFYGKVVLGGSFVNGKATARSDIDLSIGDRNLIQEVRVWQKQTPLKIQPNIEPAQFYGQLNPMVLEISEKEIRLLVFPPAKPMQASDRLMALPPQVYLLR